MEPAGTTGGMNGGIMVKIALDKYSVQAENRRIETGKSPNEKRKKKKSS